jgi:class 3 adenylate cyclase
VTVAGHRPRLRTGIHLGRPRKVGRDYLGIDVNVAARLADAAKPEEILVSDRTLRALDAQVVSSQPRQFRARGAPADMIVHVVSPLRKGVALRD